ncbi:MAG: ATP-binding protein [Chloroflexota bacterium]|nr:ATP-binding protein [Chloroflexota bacterium]
MTIRWDMAPKQPVRRDDTATEVLAAPPEMDGDETPQTAVQTRLVCVAGVDLGRTFRIEADQVVIGRGPAVEVSLRARDVSRKHARLLRERGSCFLEDLDSSNGTSLNGLAIRGRAPLLIGDRVQLGSTILVFSRHDELEERLRRLQKLEAMMTGVRGLGHDFNNVLMVVQAGLEHLDATLPPGDPEVVHTLHDMRSAVESATALVKRLNGVGRSRVAPHDLVSVTPLVEETLGMARRLVGDQIMIVPRLCGGLVVRGSRDELQQVLLNLIVNARDAMADGGELTVGVALIHLDRASALACHLASEGDFVELTVADSGHGMDEATLARIFEPYFTTKPAGRGSGLGLATSYGTVRSHGGAILVDSTPNRGTTFRIRLAVAAAS